MKKNDNDLRALSLQCKPKVRGNITYKDEDIKKTLTTFSNDTCRASLRHKCNMRVLDSSLKRICEEAEASSIPCSYRTRARRCSHGRLGFSTHKIETDKCDECQHWDCTLSKDIKLEVTTIIQKLRTIQPDFFRNFHTSEEDLKEG